MANILAGGRRRPVHGERVRRCVRAVALLAAAASISGALQAAPVTLEQALQLAQQQAPTLAARRAAAEAAQQQRTAAGRLPDPKLTVGVENFPVSGPDRLSWDRESMTMRRVGVMQDVPNRAKRVAQQEAARAAAEREQVLLRAEQLTVRRETAAAWLAHHYAERRLAVFDELLRENRVLQDTLAARLASGSAMPADAVMARQEALELAERQDELQAGAAQAAAGLRRWLGDAFDGTTAGSPEIPLDLGRLLSGLERHAELAAYAPMLSMAQADLQEAQAAKRGDWGWEVAYANRARGYGDMVSLQLSFELPVSPSTRQDPQIAARHKAVEQVRAEREDMLRRLRAEIDGQVAELQRLERALQRQRAAALPLAADRVRLATASYQAGRADLGSVLAARKDAAQARLRAVDLEAQLMAQRARLAYLVLE
jgi:outer membrane protein TolC